METETTVEVGGHTIRIVHPANADELLDERAFEQEEFLPYWAELWPSAIALARALAAVDLVGARVLELGCGLALPSVTAALGGAQVLATDWSTDALAYAARNASGNGVAIETARLAWGAPEPVPRGFELVLAADVLYERRNVEQLVSLLPLLADDVLLADPGRPALAAFLVAAASAWAVERTPVPELPLGALYRLRRRETYA